MRPGIVVLFGWALLLPLVSLAQPTSTYFSYQGYSEPMYKSPDKQSVYVPMEDSVLLAADVLLPTAERGDKVFPAVLMFTPYNRSYFIPRMGPFKHLISTLTGNGWGPIYDMRKFDFVERLLAHGYVVVVADMRGTGASFGSQMPLMPQIGRDGKSLVDWMAAQPWSDGQIGMMGPSYMAWAQFMTAAQAPEALKCIMPEVIGMEMFTAGNRPGGIAAQRWLRTYSERLQGYNQNAYDLRRFILPATPVVDEDGDGQLTDERPELDSLSLAQGRPVYRDRSPRSQHLYFSATRAHLDNVPVAHFLQDSAQYFDSQGPAPYDTLSYAQSNPAYYLPALAASGIPIYHVGGWFDGFTKGSCRLYASLAASNPSKLLMAPRVHFPRIPKGYRKFFDYEGQYVEQLSTEQLRFFDHHLKGIQNGIMEEPPVHLYVMNEGWRSEAGWPLAREERQKLFFQAGNGLGHQKPSREGVDTFSVDFRHSSSYGKKLINRWLMYTLGPKQVMDRSLLDLRCQTYETPPLEEALEITGHPVVNLWLSADQAQADVFVYLCDVDEQGRSRYITEGQLRAGWHRLQDPLEQSGGRARLLPELPWHGYQRHQWDEAPLAQGRLIELRFDLQPTSWKLAKGHRLRIAIAGADRVNFELNPYLCPDGKCPETRYHLHRSQQHASYIELPIIPSQEYPKTSSLR